MTRLFHSVVAIPIPSPNNKNNKFEEEGDNGGSSMLSTTTTLTREQYDTFKALVDTSIPVTHMIRSSVQQPKLRLSLDVNFWMSLRQRLSQDSFLVLDNNNNNNNNNNHNDTNNNNNHNNTTKSLLHQLLEILGSKEGTCALAEDSTFLQPFSKLSLTQQSRWIQLALERQPPNTSNNNKTDDKKQFQHQPYHFTMVLRRLYQCIAQTAVSYHSKNPLSMDYNIQGNPFWKVMGYPGTVAHALGRIRDAQILTSRSNINPAVIFPPPPPSSSSSLNNGTLDCDIVIVGSGAAGSVAASVLSQAGYSVLVVEQGSRPHPTAANTEQQVHLTWKRHWNVNLTQSDISMTVSTASVVGGSAVWHSGACPSLPESIRQIWAQSYGLPDFHKSTNDTISLYLQSLRTVQQHLKLITHTHHNMPNDKLRQASIQFGFPWMSLPQNVPRHDFLPGGFLELGDRYGQRITPSWFYLTKAAQTGNCHLLDQTRITQILFHKKTATGVMGIHHQGQVVQIQARQCVILAAGALETPILLAKSGIHQKHLGKHLKLQPNIAVLGFTNTSLPTITSNYSMDTLEGLSQTIACSVMDGNETVALILSHSLHPAWMARQLAPVTTAPDQLLRRLQRFRYCLPWICSLWERESEGSISKDGTILYQWSERDELSFRKALWMATRMQIAVGAREVTTARIHDKLGHGSSAHQAALVEEFLSQILLRGKKTTVWELFSDYCPVGSCRMSQSASRGVVDTQGQVWDYPRLYVLDASILPTATLVHPLVTILACAHMLATKLAKQLATATEKKSDNHPPVIPPTEVRAVGQQKPWVTTQKLTLAVLVVTIVSLLLWLLGLVLTHFH